MTIFQRMPSLALASFSGEILLAILLPVAIVLAARHRGTNHHWLMLGIFLADVVVFKTIMYVRAFSGAFGLFPFDNLIFVHMIVSWIWVIAGIATIYFAFKYRTVRKGRMFMLPKGQIHRLTGFIAAGSWYLAFLIGISVFIRYYS